MKKMNKISLVSAGVSLAVIILAGGQLLGMWGNATYVFEPLMGIVLLLNAIRYWNKSRKLAISSLCVSIFLFLVSIILWAEYLLY